ncbi:MAG: hypothetical protein ACQKBU_01605, partial [Verrucomicrobiales bacterium]
LVRQGGDLIDRGKGLFDGEGDAMQEAEDVIRSADEIVRGVRGVFGIFGGEAEVEDEGSSDPTEVLPGEMD